MRRDRGWIGVIIACWLLLAAPTAQAAGALPVGSLEELQQAISEAAGQVVYLELTEPIAAEKVQITIPADTEVHLTSAGQENQVMTTSTRHFEVLGILHLYNLTLEGGGSHGGVTVKDGGQLYLEEGLVIQNCYAIYGGGVNVWSGGRAVMNGGTLTGNRANNYGAAVDNRGYFALNGGEIHHNTATNGGGGGGGIYVASGADFLMTGGVIHNNEGYQGGGLFLSSASRGEIRGGTIRDNQAVYWGGGIYLREESHLTIRELTLQDNYCAEDGGGAVVYNAYLRIEGGTYRGNQAELRGGAIYALPYEVIVTDGLFEGNQAANGGAIYLRVFLNSGAELESVLRVGGGRFVGNVAQEDGGALYTQAYTPEHFTVAAAVRFADNTAQRVVYPPEAALYPQIRAAATSVSYPGRENNPLNNYDINMEGEAPPPSLLTVRYHANGGQGGQSLQVAPESAHTLLSAEQAGISRGGYSFLGWTLDAGGAGRVYAPGQALTVTQDLDLYAQWQKDETDGGTDNGGNGGKDKDKDKDKGGATTPTAPQTGPPSLTDAHIWYVQGYPDGSFRADGAITRAEVAAVFYRLITDGDKSGSHHSRFADVQAGQWYEPMVGYLTAKGLMEGYPDGSFRPNAPITRAEMAAVCSRFFTQQSGRHPFSDLPEHYWASRFITNAYLKGWIMGYPDSTFRPASPITRAETVTMLNRILERHTAQRDLPQGLRRYDDLSDAHWAYPAIMEATHGHDYTPKGDSSEQWSKWDGQ